MTIYLQSITATILYVTEIINTCMYSKLIAKQVYPCRKNDGNCYNIIMGRRKETKALK